ncbi:MAG: cohesin domain-containing protein [Bacteroidota bacterium]
MKKIRGDIVSDVIIRAGFVLCCVFLFQCSPNPPKPIDVLVNPVDPLSPTFVKPVTTIVSAPDSTIVLTVSEVTILVQGNSSVSAFSYRLDDHEWSPWTVSSSITITDIDEGPHRCAIRSLHRDNITIEEHPPVIRFAVNAVTGPALMFASRRKEVVLGSTFNYYVVAEEVIDIYGSKLVFTYDSDAVRIDAIQPGSIPNINVQLLEQRYGNTVRAEMFFTGGTPMRGISGSDSIIVISCTALRAGETAFTFVSDSMQLRDPNNNVVIINQFVNGKVVVR